MKEKKPCKCDVKLKTEIIKGKKYYKGECRKHKTHFYKIVGVKKKTAKKTKKKTAAKKTARTIWPDISKSELPDISKSELISKSKNILTECFKCGRKTGNIRVTFDKNKKNGTYFMKSFCPKCNKRKCRIVSKNKLWK